MGDCILFPIKASGEKIIKEKFPITIINKKHEKKEKITTLKHALEKKLTKKELEILPDKIKKSSNQIDNQITLDPQGRIQISTDAIVQNNF